MRWFLLLVLAVGGCGDSNSSPPDGVDGLNGGDGGDAPDAVDALDTSTAPDSDDTDPTDPDTPDTPLVIPTDRAPGERTPLTSRCDDTEPATCLLPWPSSAFLVADNATETGVRVAIEDDVLAPDEGLGFVAADGFSRITPIVLAIPQDQEAAGYRLRLFVAEPGERFGAEVALDVRAFPGRAVGDPTSLIGYPRKPLAPKSEHLAVLVAVTDDALAAVPPTRPVELALGADPTTDDEARRVAYHAPARLLLASTDVASDRVVRIWDFVTRSAEDPRATVREMASFAREAVVDGHAAIAIDSAVTGSAPRALIVEGTISGLPDPTSPLPGDTPGAAAYETFAVPFRVVVPTGEGDYRFVIYSHGASGNVRDTAFDGLIAGAGAAKVNVEIDGWTEAALPESIAGLLIPLAGSQGIVTKMRRALAGISAIQAAVEGPLGDLLTAPTVAGIDNPAAGRRPLIDRPIWTGGSLGGVIGAVYGNLEPSIAGGVLNVPGAGFTHWLAQSSFTGLLDLALASRYPAMVDQQVVAAMAQTIWDEVDGAIWADARETRPVFLVQMSVGDPVMPNIGTAMVARAFDAVMTLPDGEDPILGLEGLERAPEVVGKTGFTEYRTSETSASAVHGFAAGNSAAGIAARAQISAFIASLWAGAPVITIPAECQATARPGVCDFAP